MDARIDIDYLTAGVPELETYLLSNELYYPIGARLPQLTLGGILLAIVRSGLRAESFRARVDAIRRKWLSAWEAKAEREVNARSKMWTEFLAEYRDDHGMGATLYPQNVRHRAMLSLLGQALLDSDALLRSNFIEGGFVWEEACAQNFERKTFWYLFGTLKE